MHPYDVRFFERNSPPTAVSASTIVPLVMDIARPASVVDVGCALGEWLVAFERHGVRDFLGIDGQYVRKEMLLIPQGRFEAHDLTQPIQIDRSFDLAISMEVAEHLPESSSDGFVGSLVRLAPVVLFSAAIPHQGGTGHRNEQWQSYWAEKFAALDYVAIDGIRPRVWGNPSVSAWYRQNTLLYARRSLLDTNPSLRSAHEQTRAEQLDIVLPELYLRKAMPSTKKLLRMLRRRLVSRFLNRPLTRSLP